MNAINNEKEKANNKEKYELIDIMKFICAIFVIAMHSGIVKYEDGTTQWYIINILFRIAVPFFFIVSGFLFGKKYLINKEKLKENSIKQIKRLIIPYIFWAIVITPYIIHANLTFNGNIIIFILRVFRLILFNGYHLWFVLALIVAICIEYIFLKKNKMKLAIFFSIILYSMALLGNSYYFLIEGTPIQYIMDIIIKIFTMVRNGIFVGFPLFTIGICVAFYEKNIYKISNKKIYAFLLLFIITQILEATFIRGKNYKEDHSLFISVIFIATILLIICIKNKEIRFKKINVTLLRNLSTGIYYMHFPIMRYMGLLIPNMGYISIFLSTTFISIIINMILLKINNKYINLLIK